MDRKVYLILSDTGTLFTRMIKLYTKKPYNHASISFDPCLSEVYSFGRKSPQNPFVGGFVRESIHNGLLKRAKCAIYCCSISESQFQRMNEYIKRIAENKDEYRYNLIGLFAIAFHKKIHRQNAFFCSQFVATVLLEGDVVDPKIDPSLMTPYDLKQETHFQLIYQGSVNDYKDKINRNRSEAHGEMAIPWLSGLKQNY